MKAIVCTKYGLRDGLHLDEIETPTPAEEQILVKVIAASVNPIDLQIKGGLFRIFNGFLKPKDSRLGRDIAGRVESVGSRVTRFSPGDEVFGVCIGGFAEYALTRERNIAKKPANCSFEEAAAVPVAGITALQGLRARGEIRAGQKVLIQGAGGGVGMYAVQIAKSYGANVTGVCSTANIERIRSIGADRVIDYTREDFTKSQLYYDLILAVNGYHPISRYKRCLTPNGAYVAVGGSFGQIFQSMLIAPLLSKEMGKRLGSMGIARVNSDDLEVLKALLETGKIVPVIDKRYPLSETAQALMYLNQKHARGKVVIVMP